jgi:ABC-2 type transport system permease protein
MNLRVVGSIGNFEVRHFLTDKIALFTTVALPLILVSVIGLAAGSQPDAFPVGILDEDGTATSAAFAGELAEASLETTDYTTESDLARDIRLGFLSGGVIIAEGFEAALQAPSGQATVTLALDAASTNGPAVGAAITSTAAAFALEPTAVRVTTAALDLDQAEQDETAAIAAAVVADMPPITTDPVTVGDADPAQDNAFTRAVTTQFVLFVFLNGMLAGQTLVMSRRLGVARRMLSTPTGIGPHILGVGLGRWYLGLLQAAILFGGGALLFGASYGDPAATAVVAVVWTALSAAVGMVVGAVAKTADQVTAVAVPLGIGMGMLGGSMWPLSVVPEFMQTIGHLTPHAWANDAFITINEDGGGLADITTELGVLITATVVLSALAVVLLRRSLSR